MTTDATILDPGERPIWAGQPHPLRYTYRKGRPAVLFGVLASAVWIFGLWLVGKDNRDGSSIVGLTVLVPCIAFGAMLALSPLWFFIRALGTTYVLTGKRAITIVSGPFPRRSSVPLSAIAFVELRDAGGGWGDVYFQQTVLPNVRHEPEVLRDGFIAIADAPQVEKLLRSTIAAQTSGSQQELSG